jgi:hypothetical protein
MAIAGLARLKTGNPRLFYDPLKLTDFSWNSVKFPHQIHPSCLAVLLGRDTQILHYTH